MLRLTSSAGVVALFVLCSFTPSTPLAAQSAADSACVPLAADPARFGDSPVYRDCQVTQAAKLKRTGVLNYPPPSGPTCVDAEVEFVVDVKGKPIESTFRVLATSTPDFAALLRREVHGWKFDPAKIDGKPVQQLVRDHYQFDRAGTVAFVVTSVNGQPGRTPIPPSSTGGRRASITRGTCSN